LFVVLEILLSFMHFFFLNFISFDLSFLPAEEEITRLQQELSYTDSCVQLLLRVTLLAQHLLQTPAYLALFIESMRAHKSYVVFARLTQVCFFYFCSTYSLLASHATDLDAAICD
jgi:hypothetical protein